MTREPSSSQAFEAAVGVAPWIAFAMIGLTIALRLYGIADNSITQDESTMILFAQGVLERGYPFLRQNYAEFVISTYELVPFPIALSMSVFGQNEFGVRVPSVVFAVGTVLLILRFGCRLFDRRVAILATLLFAVLPWATYWGSNAFYPSQAQFFALLTTMAIYRLTTDAEPRPWVYYAIFGSFIASYLSWEGCGFLLPVFFVLVIVFRFGRWRWLLDIHGWIAASLIILLVVAQLTFRTVMREPYLGIVSGRQTVSGLSLAFMSVGYDPFYYIEGLTSEAHIVLAWSLLVGVCFLRRHRALCFLYVFLLLIMAFWTGLLGYYALRYAYLALPAVLLAASAAGVLLLDRLIPDGGTSSTVAENVRVAKAAGYALLMVVHLTVATAFGVKPLEADPALMSNRPYELRHSLTGFSFRTLAQELEARIQPGDVVIVQAPFPLQVYTGDAGDYFLQRVAAASVYYDPGAFPYYTDKWVGNPVIHTADELSQIFRSNERVWLLSSPDGGSRLSITEDLYASLERRMELVHEAADGRLFLWQRP